MPHLFRAAHHPLSRIFKFTLRPIRPTPRMVRGHYCPAGGSCASTFVIGLSRRKYNPMIRYLDKPDQLSGIFKSKWVAHSRKHNCRNIKTKTWHGLQMLILLIALHKSIILLFIISYIKIVFWPNLGVVSLF